MIKKKCKTRNQSYKQHQLTGRCQANLVTSLILSDETLIQSTPYNNASDQA